MPPTVRTNGECLQPFVLSVAKRSRRAPSSQSPLMKTAETAGCQEAPRHRTLPRRPPRLRPAPCAGSARTPPPPRPGPAPGRLCPLLRGAFDSIEMAPFDFASLRTNGWWHFPVRPERSEAKSKGALITVCPNGNSGNSRLSRSAASPDSALTGHRRSGPHLAQARQEHHHHRGQGQHHGAHAHYGVRGADEVGADPGHQRSGGRDAAVQHVDAHDPAP